MEAPELETFSIIIPIYNEENIIVNSTFQNIAVLKSAQVNYEIILVNDGSSDNSSQLITDNFEPSSQIRIINLMENMGFGGAVKTGISMSKHKFILCVPVDSPLTSETFNAFKEAAHKADIIVSYRIARLGYTPLMRWNSYIYHLLIEVLFDIHLADFNWIHLYNRKIFDEGKIKIKSKGIFMLAEILIRSQRKGYSFLEIPVVQTQRLTGIASASKLGVMLKTVWEMIVFYVR
jgi:glycosyltransferase involved in cell wall biosynthesis